MSPDIDGSDIWEVVKKNLEEKGILKEIDDAWDKYIEVDKRAIDEVSALLKDKGLPEILGENNMIKIMNSIHDELANHPTRSRDEDEIEFV